MGTGLHAPVGEQGGDVRGEDGVGPWRPSCCRRSRACSRMAGAKARGDTKECRREFRMGKLKPAGARNSPAIHSASPIMMFRLLIRRPRTCG